MKIKDSIDKLLYNVNMEPLFHGHKKNKIREHAKYNFT